MTSEAEKNVTSQASKMRHSYISNNLWCARKSLIWTKASINHSAKVNNKQNSFDWWDTIAPMYGLYVFFKSTPRASLTYHVVQYRNYSDIIQWYKWGKSVVAYKPIIKLELIKYRNKYYIQQMIETNALLVLGTQFNS